MFFLSQKITDWILNIVWYPYRKLKDKLNFKGKFVVALTCCLFTVALFPIAFIGAIIGYLIEPLFIAAGLAVCVAYFKAKRE